MQAIFSDVDDTLIQGKSLLGFVKFLEDTASPSDARGIAETMDKILLALRVGALPRTELNRLFYTTIMANREVEHVCEAGRLWYQHAALQSEFYKRAVCRYLASARTRGIAVVLVSGSFAELLEPIARDVGATAMLVTRLERSGAVYTGRVLGPIMIGPGKAAAVNAYAAAHDIDLESCVSIGDDVTDVPFLTLTGKSYVPADSGAEMLMLARERGWSLLSP